MKQIMKPSNQVTKYKSQFLLAIGSMKKTSNMKAILIMSVINKLPLVKQVIKQLRLLLSVFIVYIFDIDKPRQKFSGKPFIFFVYDIV